MFFIGVYMEDSACWQSKFEACDYSIKLINKIISLNNQNSNKVHLDKIKKALYYAKKYHGTQKRDTGEPYYSHPLEVAYMVSDYKFNTDILVTCILHDVIEDTAFTKDLIKHLFGPVVAEQVDSLTRIKQDRKYSVPYVLNLLCKQKQEDLLLVKYFDRLHNLQSLKIKPPAKQRKIILETLKEFLPLAAHLGLLVSENQLGKLCANINISLKELSAEETPAFSFVDNYQPLLLAFQNAKYQMYNQ